MTHFSSEPPPRRLKILLLDPGIAREWRPLMRWAEVEALPLPSSAYQLHESPKQGEVDPDRCLLLAQEYSGRFDYILGECTGGFLWRAVFRLAGSSTPFVLVPRFNHVFAPNALALFLASQLRLPQDILFAGSEASRRSFARFGFACEPSYLPGVDLELFRPLSEGKKEIRTTLGLPVDRQVLLYVGRVVDDKHIFELLEVVRAVREKSTVELVVCYHFFRPEYLAECQARAEAIGGVRWVHSPPAGELVRYYNAADLFVSTAVSTFETFGRAPVEAMACGAPPVVSDYDGFRETVPSDIGFRVPTLSEGPFKRPDIAGFTRTILTALEDAEAMAERGRRAVEHSLRFDRETAIRDFVSCLVAHRADSSDERMVEVSLAEYPLEIQGLWAGLENMPLAPLVKNFLASRSLPVRPDPAAVEAYVRQWFAHY